MNTKLDLSELPQDWKRVLEWGPCLCAALNGETCPSCAKARNIEAAGLDWETEYLSVVSRGQTILM